VGIGFAILTTLFSLMFIVDHDFPIFRYADQSVKLVEDKVAIIGFEVSRFLWEQRGIDLIAQAFVLFIAAACCTALLRSEEAEK